MTDDFKHISLENAVTHRHLYNGKRRKEVDTIYKNIGKDINIKLESGSSEDYVLIFNNPTELVLEALNKHVEVMNNMGYKVVLKCLSYNDKGDFGDDYKLIVSLK